MKFEEIKTVGVLGGGIMGGGIAQGLAIGGYQVVIRDISEEMIEATRQAVFEGKWGIKRAVELGKRVCDKEARRFGLNGTKLLEGDAIAKGAEAKVTARNNDAASAARAGNDPMFPGTPMSEA